jgi:ubiquitin C-terminal hydrolase
MFSGGIVLDKIKFVAPLLPRNRENATSNQYSEQMIKRICNLEESEQQIELEVKWEMQVGTGRGLVNMGNTCFLNSVLQCLSYCPPMFNVLYAKVHSKNCLYKDRFCLFCEMEKLAENLFPRSGSKKMPFSPIGIVKNLKAINRKYRLGRQEDAHELLMFVLDSMQNSCKPKVSSTNAGASKRVQAQSRDYISQIFEGKLQNEVKCLNCGYVSCGTESFMDINLQIVGQKSKSVEHALQQFTAVDRLYGENRYRCSKCNQLVDAEKRMVIQSLPNLLTIQLKRFHYDLYGGSKKIEKHVPFEVNIDFAPYLSSSSKCEDTKYELCGLVVHYGGGCRSGHYVSYVKASNGVWNLVDDECVSQIGINSVLKQNAYVLFYSKKASSRVSKKTPEKPEPKFEAKKPEQPSSEIKVDLKDVPKCKELSSTLYLGERLCLPVTSLALPNPIGMKPVFLQSLLSVPIISDSSQESEIMETDTKISSNSSRAPLENIVAEKRSAKSRLLFEERQSNREESTWEGIDCQVELSKKASILQSMPSQPKRKRDSWDILLDQGKEKKIKSSKNSFLSSSSSKLSVNKFQQYLQSKKKKPF